MVWRELLLTSVLALAAPHTFAGSCASGDDLITGCINGDGVDVVVHTDGPGTDGTGGSGDDGGGGSGGPPVIWKCLEVTCDEDDPGAEPIRLSDIATFHPVPGVDHLQPDGWTVPGLHTNIYATTSRHVVDGTLLGQPASVRFTPVSYHWQYGDGTTADLATHGATWNALGLREFDRTPTSHVYAREGSYTIRLVIDFAAEYRFAGGPFSPIAGVLPVRANDLRIVVDGAKTVLVERDCAQNPSGPGC